MGELGPCQRCRVYVSPPPPAVIMHPGSGNPVCEDCAGRPPGEMYDYLPMLRTTHAVEELVRILSQRAYLAPCDRCGCAIVPADAVRCPVCAKMIAPPA